MIQSLHKVSITSQYLMVNVSKNVLNRSNYSISIYISDIVTQFHIDRYPHTYQKCTYYVTQLRLRDEFTNWRCCWHIDDDEDIRNNVLKRNIWVRTVLRSISVTDCSFYFSHSYSISRFISKYPIWCSNWDVTNVPLFVTYSSKRWLSKGSRQTTGSHTDDTYFSFTRFHNSNVRKR